MEFPPEIVWEIFSYKRLKKTAELEIIPPWFEHGGYRRYRAVELVSISKYAEISYLIMIRSLSRGYWAAISLEYIAANCDVEMFRKPIGAIALRNHLLTRQLTDEYLPCVFPATWNDHFSRADTKWRVKNLARFNELTMDIVRAILGRSFDNIEEVEQHEVFDTLLNYKSKNDVIVGILKGLPLAGNLYTKDGLYATGTPGGPYYVPARVLLSNIMKDFTSLSRPKNLTRSPLSVSQLFLIGNKRSWIWGAKTQRVKQYLEASYDQQSRQQSWYGTKPITMYGEVGVLPSGVFGDTDSVYFSLTNIQPPITSSSKKESLRRESPGMYYRFIDPAETPNDDGCGMVRHYVPTASLPTPLTSMVLDAHHRRGTGFLPATIGAEGRKAVKQAMNLIERDERAHRRLADAITRQLENRDARAESFERLEAAITNNNRRVKSLKKEQKSQRDQHRKRARRTKCKVTKQQVRGKSVSKRGEKHSGKHKKKYR